MFHAKIETESLIPLRKWPLETTSAFYYFLVSQLKKSIYSIQASMIVIRHLLIGTSLILEGVKESVSMHVDVGLLTEKALSISVKAIKEPSVIIVISHHLLMFKLVLFILELLYALKRTLPNWHIAR